MSNRAPAVAVCVAVVSGLVGGCGDVDWSNPFAPKPDRPAPPGMGEPGRGRPPLTARAGEGTTYTILLRAFTDPVSHVEAAEFYRQSLTQGVGWKDLFVVHQAGHSELFWGRYATIQDAQPNLRAAKTYRAQNGAALFVQAMVVPLPGEDIGPPEWNLRKCQGTYSLLVAVFRDDPERNYVGRKRFAVDYCRRLRQSGFEGYYYHEPAVSNVTIGAFGPEAVTIRQTDAGPEMVINDPKIRMLQDDEHFPLLQFNGAGVNDIVYDRAGKPTSIPRRTYLIRVPAQ